jgi:hypothetical protein
MQPVRSKQSAACLLAGACVALLIGFVGSPSSARSLRVRCVDGGLTALVRQGGGVRQVERVCDLDQACDGACNFGFCGFAEFRCAHDPFCGGAQSGVCEPCECPTDTIVVGAGRRRVITDSSGAKLILRCTRRCATCEIDAECDDGNGCSRDRCVDRACTHDCLCVAPGDIPTCCPGPVLVCPPATPCGPDSSCDSASEICVSRGPVGPSVVYACEPVPAGCELERNCACGGARLCQPPFDTCRDAASNEIFCECIECQ